MRLEGRLTMGKAAFLWTVPQGSLGRGGLTVAAAVRLPVSQARPPSRRLRGRLRRETMTEVEPPPCSRSLLAPVWLGINSASGLARIAATAERSSNLALEVPSRERCRFQQCEPLKR